MTETTRRLPVTLAAVGLLSSLALEWVHATAYLAPWAASFCTVGARLDCGTVALSRLSVILGIPLPLWGAAGFLAMLLAAWRGSALLVSLSGFAAVASVFLLAAELTTIHSVCLLCEVVHVTSWALFYVAWKRRESLRAPDRAEAARILGGPAAALAIAWVAVPSYWAVFSWRSGIHLPHGVDADGNPWIGAENPVVTAHEYVDYSCPHCRLVAGRMRRTLAEHATTLRIVRHQFPRMRCPRLPPYPHCQPARVAICAGDQGKFWEADTWLFDHARGKGEVDPKAAARDLGLDEGKLLACTLSPETFKRADDMSRAATKSHVVDAPTYLVDGKKIVGSDIFTVLEKRL